MLMLQRKNPYQDLQTRAMLQYQCDGPSKVSMERGEERSRLWICSASKSETYLNFCRKKRPLQITLPVYLNSNHNLGRQCR